MKKLFFLLALTLTACTTAPALPEESTPPPAETSDLTSYNSSVLNISFDYPSNWELKENESITITSPATDDAGTIIMITIPAESFDEYENAHQSEIDRKMWGMSVKETSITTKNKTYQAKEYGVEGWLYYLIQVDEHYVGVGSERYMNEEQEEGLGIILDSISLPFKE